MAGGLALLLLGAAPPLDSQIVLAKYAHALANVPTPKIAIFSYAVSQAGPNDIEQRHRIYRSGQQVRDEIVSVDGTKPKLASISIGRREDRYAIARLAPRAGAYQMLFVRAVVADGRTDYLFDTTPYVKTATGFTVTHVTIDGLTFLPRAIGFHTASLGAHGDGEILYAPFARYWMPVLASISAAVAGTPARERIAFGEYRFPTSLPPSTFGKR